jgi:hypothetical protein
MRLTDHPGLDHARHTNGSGDLGNVASVLAAEMIGRTHHASERKDRMLRPPS